MVTVSPSLFLSLSLSLQHVGSYQVTLQAGLSQCSKALSRSQPAGHSSDTHIWREGENSATHTNQPSCTFLSYYCKTSSNGGTPKPSALCELYYVQKCPSESELKSLHSTIASSLFGSHSNDCRYTHPVISIAMAMQ